MATYVVAAILAVILIFAVRSIIKTKKKGGCVGCDSCSGGEGESCLCEELKKMSENKKNKK